MNAISLPATCTSGVISTALQYLRSPYTSSQSHTSVFLRRKFPASSHSLRSSGRDHVTVRSVSDHTNSPSDGYTVSDFMTRKADLLVVQTSTTVDKALEILVEKRITGFPVVDDDWNLVGVVSDYDLLALDSISVS